MFNLRPEDLFPWLRVEPPSTDEVPGFYLNPDGSSGDTRRTAASPASGFDPSASASPPMGTGLQDAMRFAPTNIYPTAYLPNGLPDFTPPPRHPLQDALDEIMRIYAGFDPHRSSPIVQQGPGTKIISPVGNWPAASYAPQSPVPNDDSVASEGPPDAASNTRPDLQVMSQLPVVDSAEAAGIESWPLAWLPGTDTSRDATTAPQADREPIPDAATGDAWPKPPMDGWPYAQANGAESEIARPAVAMPQPARVLAPPWNAPIADSNFILANAGAAENPQAEFGMPPQNGPAELQYPVTPTAPASRPPEERTERTLSQSIEDYRRAAAAGIGELESAVSTFGKQLYEDSFLTARDNLARLADRFSYDPVGATLSVLNSFPQTRVEGEFAASFAAAYIFLANVARGLEFERAVFEALNAAQQAIRINKNTTKISVEGMGRSVPDILHQGIREIKDVVEIDSSVQLRVQAAYARAFGMPFSLIVSPSTKRISDSVQQMVRDTGGTIQRFDPATGTFTPFR